MIEVDVTFGWKAISCLPMLVIGIDSLDASALGNILAEKYGFTTKQVFNKVLSFTN